MRLPPSLTNEFSYMTAKETHTHFINNVQPPSSKKKEKRKTVVVSGITMPARIGHNYTPLQVLNIDQLYDKYKDHRRLRVFANKGLKCEYCPKVGIYLIRCISNAGSIHVDVYTETFELMTIDHVFPKSKGGHSTLENLVPACHRCNVKKSNKIITV